MRSDAGTELERAVSDIALTTEARAILEHASRIAAERGADATSPADVLEATLQDPKSAASREIVALGVSPTSIHVSADSNGAVTLRQLVINANREAQVLGHYRVDSIHLLLAMLYSDTPSTSAALQAAGLSLYGLRSHVQTGVTTPDEQLRRKPWPSLRGVQTISPVFAGLLMVTAAAGALLWSGVAPGAAGFITLVFVTAGWITSLCIHEFGHALVAYLGGDRSVAASGYLSLNPLRYTNVVFSILLPVLFLLLGGIGLPGGAVYVNHSALRTKWWSSAVSLAGPFGTLLCAVAVSAPFVLGGAAQWEVGHIAFAAGLAFLAFVQCFALVLNMVPVPGLDGFGVIRPWLPFAWQVTASRLGMNGIFLVFMVLWFFAPLRNGFYQLVFQLTALAQINPILIFVGQSHMRLL